VTYAAPDASRTDTAALLRQAGVPAPEIEEMVKQGAIA